MDESNIIYNEDCFITARRLDNESIDMIITSPPYDNLRTYNGYQFDFDKLSLELFRIIKPGGVMVWIVGDATINGSETGTSFKQALRFMDVGFRLHDTMIWKKSGFTATGSLKVRYAPVFEYMFILSKGAPKSFHPIKDRKTRCGGSSRNHWTIRQRNGLTKPVSKRMVINEYGQRYNIWDVSAQKSHKDSSHPSSFPEQLICDHIISWSEEGDLVYDPFMGGGTTAIACMRTSRRYIGSEISAEYCEIASKRIARAER